SNEPGAGKQHQAQHHNRAAAQAKCDERFEHRSFQFSVFSGQFSGFSPLVVDSRDLSTGVAHKLLFMYAPLMSGQRPGWGAHIKGDVCATRGIECGVMIIAWPKMTGIADGRLPMDSGAIRHSVFSIDNRQSTIINRR
ncbi:MAG: hypothetical protein ACLQVL_20800, partial [Terriglobia bacterium]